MPGIFESDQRASGLVEQELTDSYYLAQADKVPFSALLPRGQKPSGFLMEWPMKKRARRPVPGMMDGVDQSTYGHTERDKANVYGQDVRTKGWMATKHANITKTAGVQMEAAEQELDDGIELTQMIERLLLSSQDTQAAASPATPYLLRSVFEWLNPSAQATFPVPADYRPAAASQYTGVLDDFTPDSLEAMLISAAEARFEPVTLELFAGIRLKSRMSKWAQRDTDVSGETFLQHYNIDAAAKRYLRLVDHFSFDAGIRNNPISVVVLADSMTWCLRFAQRTSLGRRQ